MFAANRNFRAPDEKLEKKIDKIIASMTIEEKIDLIGGDTTAGHTIGNKRLGIPEFKLADGPAGVHWFTKMSTTYPALILAAATFDVDLIHKMGVALGRDCRARGIHILLAPGVNMYRSPLCGRNFEYCGEDPFLAGKIAAAYIRGVQSEGVSATIKHFVLNFQEYDRNEVSSDVDERTLREIYLPAFEIAVKEGGTGCLMTSYNLLNGIHTSEHKELITDILKEEWGFDGVVMSDWNSVYDSINPVNAGLDLEMPWKKFMTHEKIIPAIKEGKIKPETIDDKVRRILRLAFSFGWMENGQRDFSIPVADAQTMQTALDVARNGLVLLKNDDDLLPFDRNSLKKIAVIGPCAHPAVIGGGGSAYNVPSHTVSILDALNHLANPEIEVVHAVGVDPTRAYKTFEKSVFYTRDNGQGLQAEYFNNDDLTGEPAVRRIDSALNFKWGEFPPMP
ncbi:MAG: glycoside hydrolase family 3 protein, partial [Spirochaetales bacterium]|nr:glycoside hydrolase family 3 protein [Spirochaetales bacterium]